MFYKNTVLIGCTPRISQEKKSCGQKLPLNDVVLCNYSWLESRGRRIGNLKKSFWNGLSFQSSNMLYANSIKNQTKNGICFGLKINGLSIWKHYLVITLPGTLPCCHRITCKSAWICKIENLPKPLFTYYLTHPSAAEGGTCCRTHE